MATAHHPATFLLLRSMVVVALLVALLELRAHLVDERTDFLLLQRERKVPLHPRERLLAPLWGVELGMHLWDLHERFAL